MPDLNDQSTQDIEARIYGGDEPGEFDDELEDLEEGEPKSEDVGAPELRAGTEQQTETKPEGAEPAQQEPASTEQQSQEPRWKPEGETDPRHWAPIRVKQAEDEAKAYKQHYLDLVSAVEAAQQQAQQDPEPDPEVEPEAHTAWEIRQLRAEVQSLRQDSQIARTDAITRTVLPDADQLLGDLTTLDLPPNFAALPPETQGLLMLKARDKQLESRFEQRLAQIKAEAKAEARRELEEQARQKTATPPTGPRAGGARLDTGSKTPLPRWKQPTSEIEERIGVRSRT